MPYMSPNNYFKERSGKHAANMMITKDDLSNTSMWPAVALFPFNPMPQLQFDCQVFALVFFIEFPVCPSKHSVRDR